MYCSRYLNFFGCHACPWRIFKVTRQGAVRKRHRNEKFLISPPPSSSLCNILFEKRGPTKEDFPMSLWSMKVFLWTPLPLHSKIGEGRGNKGRYRTPFKMRFNQNLSLNLPLKLNLNFIKLNSNSKDFFALFWRIF